MSGSSAEVPGLGTCASRKLRPAVAASERVGLSEHGMCRPWHRWANGYVKSPRSQDRRSPIGSWRIVGLSTKTDEYCCYRPVAAAETTTNFSRRPSPQKFLTDFEPAF